MKTIKGAINKVRMLKFRNFRPNSLPVRARKLLAKPSTHPPPPPTPSTSVWIWLFKEDMTEIYFVTYYQSKNHKQR